MRPWGWGCIRRSWVRDAAHAVPHPLGKNSRRHDCSDWVIRGLCSDVLFVPGGPLPRFLPPQLRVVDSRGEARNVFMYFEEPEPHFDFEDMIAGNVMTVQAPRAHVFMDQSLGLRLDDPKAIRGTSA